MTSSRLPTDHLWPLPVGVAAAAAIFTALRAACRRLLERLPWPHGHGQHVAPWPAEADERRASTDVIAACRAPWPRAPRPEHLAPTMVPAVAEALAPLPRYEDRVTTPDVPGDPELPGALDQQPRSGVRLAGQTPESGAPGTLPAWAVELNHGHTDNDAAVESMLHRALTPELLAVLDAQKEASDA